MNDEEATQMDGSKANRKALATAAQGSETKGTTAPLLNRHPVAEAWDDFQANNASLFRSAADGQYLANRLSAAFSAGWFAAEQCVTEALRCNARERRKR